MRWWTRNRLSKFLLATAVSGGMGRRERSGTSRGWPPIEAAASYSQGQQAGTRPRR